MLVSVNVDILGPSLPLHRRLPPPLVQFGTEGLVLIELQGALEVEGEKDGQLVGKLRVEDNSKKATLMIGHHLLEGKLVDLAKPLAVMHRNQPEFEGINDDFAMAVDESDAHGNAQVKSWDIVAVVKKKMVFSKRPMPIVGRTPSIAPSSHVGSKA